MKKITLFILIALLLTSCSMKDKTLAVDPEDSDMMLIEIKAGSSGKAIASLLKEKDLIRSERAFKNLAKELKKDSKMKAGTYKLSRSMDAETIINKLASGDVYEETIKFTIPEGFELKDIEKRLTENKIVQKAEFDKALTKTYDYKFLEGVDTLEGYLFPDTYIMKLDYTSEDIVNKMLLRFDQIFKPEYYDRAKELGMSINEVITLASIIEREAMSDEEFKIVSSVFHNRIKKEMKLQSCATVQYILGERKARLTFDDIAIESPFNTYINAGLPPSPIANPGEKAIIAALYPEDTEYFYFVAKNDGSGKHVFSKTLAEHNKAKEENR